HHRVAAAERLRKAHFGTCRNGMRDPAGNLRCNRVTCRSCCIARFQLLLPIGLQCRLSAYSVDTACSSPFSAALIACHARVAHLTRNGNSETPANTPSLPNASGSPPLPVTRSWKRVKKASASCADLPFSDCVIIEADAFEMAHPAP